MKRFIYLFICLAIFTSCGDSSESTSENNVEGENVVKLKGHEELDLTPWGFEMLLMVPNADANGEPEITLTDGGSLKVLIGRGYGIEIMFGEGDLNLLKTDLKEDLVFTAEIVREEENTLIYTQSIPDSDVKVQNHFFFKKELGNDVYEVKDLMEGQYSLPMIEKMLTSIKTITYKSLETKEEV